MPPANPWCIYAWEWVWVKYVFSPSVDTAEKNAPDLGLTAR